MVSGLPTINQVVISKFAYARTNISGGIGNIHAHFSGVASGDGLCGWGLVAKS